MQALRDGFSGTDETPEDVDFLANSALARFRDRVPAGLQWLPHTSELVGPVGTADEMVDEAGELRGEVTNAVWEEWCHGELAID
jgi:hypothetical protein